MRSGIAATGCIRGAAVRKSAPKGSKHHAMRVWHSCNSMLPGMTPKSVLLPAALGIQQWLGCPKSLPWRVLVPHGYLHVIVCAVLGVNFGRPGRSLKVAFTIS